MWTENNNQFYPLPSGVKTRNNLPPGVYDLLLDKQENLYLQKSEENFKLPPKFYGKSNSYKNKILRKYRSRKELNTGILASGSKGSGKSLLLKQVSSDIVENGGVVINIGISVSGQELSSCILQNLDKNQDCMVNFDEFEKVFSSEEQEKILTVLDGGLVYGILFFLTVNKLHKVDDNLINRPGRIFYHIRYDGLDKPFIEEYCADNLNGQKYLDKITNLASLIDSFNFDMLQAIVSEINESPDDSFEDIVEILNISVSKYKDHQDYEYKIIKKGEENISKKYEVEKARNPLTSDDWVCFSPTKEFSELDCVEFNVNRMSFKMAIPDGYMMTYDDYTILVTKIKKETDLSFFLTC